MIYDLVLEQHFSHFVVTPDNLPRFVTLQHPWVLLKYLKHRLYTRYYGNMRCIPVTMATRGGTGYIVHVHLSFLVPITAYQISAYHRYNHVVQSNGSQLLIIFHLLLKICTFFSICKFNPWFQSTLVAYQHGLLYFPEKLSSPGDLP